MSADPSMNPDIPNEYRRPASNAGSIFLFLLALAVIAALIPWLATRQRKGGVLTAGQKAPEITAEGWLNGEPPTAESLSGKVVFVHAWATWCGPCHKRMPYIVEIHKQFADRGVVFIGLTSEDEESLPLVKKYVEQSGITWLNGWGAIKTLRELDAQFIPCAFVIGADGQLLWSSNQDGTADEVLEQALALANRNASKP